jgi:hypothetical protein
MIKSSNWSLHDLILVDCKYPLPAFHASQSHKFDLTNRWCRLAPEFHVIVQEGSNGEIYNMAIRGRQRLTSYSGR